MGRELQEPPLLLEAEELGWRQKRGDNVLHFHGAPHTTQRIAAIRPTGCKVGQLPTPLAINTHSLWCASQSRASAQSHPHTTSQGHTTQQPAAVPLCQHRGTNILVLILNCFHLQWSYINSSHYHSPPELINTNSNKREFAVIKIAKANDCLPHNIWEMSSALHLHREELLRAQQHWVFNSTHQHWFLNRLAKSVSRRDIRG